MTGGASPDDAVRRDDAALHDVLAAAQRLGMLGDRPIVDVVRHARAFVDALIDVEGSVLDLGSGGGVPGLVIAWDRPDLRVVLLDRRARRTDHLRRAVARLGLSRAEVWTGDAQTLVQSRPERFDAVTARGFGPPERTLTVAVRWLSSRGRVVISDPPDHDRWPADLLAELGLERVRSPHVSVFHRR